MIDSIIQHFSLPGQVVNMTPLGNGHINTTFKLDLDNDESYVLQKINTSIFHNPEGLMHNIRLVTDYIAARSDDPREVMTLVSTKDGKDYCVDNEEYWRIFTFVPNSISYDLPDTPKLFYDSAVAFGRFQSQLNDFPVDQLVDTIPNFHNTIVRYASLDNAIENDVKGRVAAVKNEISFAMSEREFGKTLVNLTERGELPLRVTHNDTKLNNILFDKDTGKSLCIVDLDTVMPGLVVNDFGESIRFGASSAVEDENDLTKVFLRLDYYDAYVDGFLSVCRAELSALEIKMLPTGAKMMTLENGVRFLTDYLVGDTYFKIGYPDQNLARCRAQFKLVQDMNNKWDKMQI